MRKIPAPAPNVYWISIILLTLFALCPLQALAKDPVVGRYLQASGETIRLQLTVRDPAPQTLILQQLLPAGTRVTSTSPRAKKISQHNGEVKWLFTGVARGKIEVVMRVQPPVPAGTVKGSFRYRMPNGAMREGHVGK